MKPIIVRILLYMIYFPILALLIFLFSGHLIDIQNNLAKSGLLGLSTFSKANGLIGWCYLTTCQSSQ